MNVSVLILAICTSAVLAMLAGERHGAEARNVARLAEHFGWARSDAAEVYAMARRIGFGAACMTVRRDRRRLVA